MKTLETIIEQLDFLLASETFAKEINKTASVSESLKKVLNQPKTSETGVAGLINDLTRLNEIHTELAAFFYYNNCSCPNEVDSKMWYKLQDHMGFDDSE